MDNWTHPNVGLEPIPIIGHWSLYRSMKLIRNKLVRFWKHIYFYFIINALA